MKHESDGDTNGNRCDRNDLKRIGKRTRRLRNQRTSEEHPNYNIIKIGQNTENTVTQASLKDH